MKTFHQFICAKESTDGGIAPGQNQTNANANLLPPTGPSPSQQYPGQENNDPPNPEVASEIEKLTNDVQRQVERLFSVIGKHNMNKKNTAQLLTTLISNIAGNVNMSDANVRKIGQNALRTNSEPATTPQMGYQPQAV